MECKELTVGFLTSSCICWYGRYVPTVSCGFNTLERKKKSFMGLNLNLQDKIIYSIKLYNVNIQ